jgi:hypothetical protein
MSESISLVITFIVIAVVYEYLRPKDDESTNQPKDPSDEED